LVAALVEEFDAVVGALGRGAAQARAELGRARDGAGR
jgi:hypothetical protein